MDEQLINKLERVYPVQGKSFTTQGMKDELVYHRGRTGLFRPTWKNHYFAKDVHKKIEDIKRDIGLLENCSIQDVLDIIDKHTGKLKEPNNSFKYGGKIE